jgi:hypothetical protein
MKLTNFDEVTTLIKIRTNVIRAQGEVAGFIEKSSACDNNTSSEDKEGYASYLHMHTDGSGAGINMSGCYVAVEAARALFLVLNQKLVRVDAALEKLGVDVN